MTGFYDHSTSEELVRECIKMKDLNHPNILRLIGICVDGGPAPFIITPFMENGSLLSYLRRNRNTFLSTENNVTSKIFRINMINLFNFTPDETSPQTADGYVSSSC